MSGNNIAKLVRSVLSSATSELVMKRQSLELAKKNLHLPDVLIALLDALPVVQDTETRNELLALLMNLNTSRFENLESLHQAFLNILKQEKDRTVRVAIIERLTQGIRQDERLGPFLVELFSEEFLNEQERTALIQAVSSLPAISQELAYIALERSKNAPTFIQAHALDIAERHPQWNASMVNAIMPYLQVKTDQALRLRVLRKLTEAKKLTLEFLPLLKQVLRNDPSVEMRQQALFILSYLKPWNEEVLEQLLWTAALDSEASIRSQATELQSDIPELNTEQLSRLANQLGADHNMGVRLSVLEILKKYVRLPEIRAALVRAFESNPSTFIQEEFDALIALLSPYVGREEGIRTSLFSAVKGLPQASQRRSLLELILPKVRLDQMLEIAIELFAREHDEGLRAMLFNQLKPLSLAKHAALVKVFCNELIEPSSPFRLACASLLSPSAELYPEIGTALEDVLLNDQERELIRVSVEGYVKPKVNKRFEPLLSVVQNETIDAISRQKCLDELLKLNLDESQQEQLSQALAGIKPNTLNIKPKA